jgi:hypothetical protein
MATKFGKCPRKPILRITLLELMESGSAFNNRFYQDTELVGIFQKNWLLMVEIANQSDIT